MPNLSHFLLLFFQFFQPLTFEVGDIASEISLSSNKKLSFSDGIDEFLRKLKRLKILICPVEITMTTMKPEEKTKSIFSSRDCITEKQQLKPDVEKVQYRLPHF